MKMQKLEQKMTEEQKILKQIEAGREEDFYNSRAFKFAGIGGIVLFISGLGAVSSMFATTGGNSATEKALHVEQATIAAQEAERDLELIKKKGLSRTFTVRDFASIDNDAIIVNSAETVVLTDAPRQLTGTPGALHLVAHEGRLGCVTVELQDEKNIYKLCLRNNETLDTFIQ